jgi:hypothetical protein
MPAAVAADTLISQSFIAEDSLPVGAVVSLKKGTTDHVVNASLNNVNYLLGVTVDNSTTQLSISGGQSNQVHVATNGIVEVLVSDIDGKITAGDPITASPVNGVGMKANASIKVIGVAQDSFPNATAGKQTYKDAKGQQQTMQIGEVPVLVNVSYYYKQPEKTLIPSSIQNVADAFAHKNVNALPILISIGIFIVTMLIVVSIIYSMIHSSIISVGRNPMSQSAIYRNVLQLSALVVVILGVAVGSIYMVLTKF